MTRILAFAMACAAFAVSSVAGEHAGPRVGPEIREVDAGDMVVEVLDNGTVIAVKRAPTRGVVSVQFRVGAGSTTEGRHLNAGISHFVEHMVFEGTTREPGRGFDMLVRSLGGAHNGYTSFDETVYYVTVPKENYKPILEGLVELVREAAMPEERFVREREVILQELREGEDDPNRLSSRLLLETIYRDHPYRYRVGGDIALFEGIALNELSAYYRSLYVPGNEMVVIAGDVNVREAVEAARAVLSQKESQPLPDTQRVREDEQTSARFAEMRHPRARNARVLYGWRTVDISHEDLYALDVLAAIMGQGRGSRLHQALREDTSLALSVGAYSWTPRDPGYLGVWVEAEDRNVARVRAAVELEVTNLRNWPPLAEELDRAKRLIESSALFGRETAEGIARSLGSDLMTTGDPYFTERYLKRVRAVTGDDVMNAARTYLAPSRISVALFRPERAFEETEEVAVMRAGESVMAEPVVEDIPGGAKLVMIRDETLPVVSVSATLLAGLRLEPEGKAGISAMLAKVMERGTEDMPADALAEAVEGRGGNYSVLSGRNSLSARVDMLSADLPVALDVALAILAEPRFDPQDFARIRMEMLAAIDARGESAWALAQEALAEALFAGHPYRFQDGGTRRSIGGITIEELQGFHGRIARRSNLVIAIAGDFPPEEARRLAAEASAKLADAAFDERVPARAAGPKARTTVTRTLHGSRSSVIVWGLPGAVMGTRDAYALDIAAQVLGGMSGRLWDAVRGEEGLAYGVGAFNNPQVDPGMFALYVSTRPDREARALELLESELARLRTDPPTDAEIRDAVAGLSGRIAISLQARGSQSLNAALYERYGLGARAAFDQAGVFATITAAEIAAVIDRYLSPEAGVVSIVRP